MIELVDHASIAGVRGGWIVQLRHWNENGETYMTEHMTTSVEVAVDLVKAHMLEAEAMPEEVESIEAAMKKKAKR